MADRALDSALEVLREEFATVDGTADELRDEARGAALETAGR